MEAGLTLREVEDVVFSNTRTLEFYNSADMKQVRCFRVAAHSFFVFCSFQALCVCGVNAISSPSPGTLICMNIIRDLLSPLLHRCTSAMAW